MPLGIPGTHYSPPGDEQFWQFNKRMAAVQDHMNSDSFAAQGGRGLPGLCKELRDRCREVIDRKGGRIPK